MAKEKARRKAENAPEVIHVSGNVKFSEFTETDEKAVNDEMSADDEKPVEEAQEKLLSQKIRKTNKIGLFFGTAQFFERIDIFQCNIS